MSGIQVHCFGACDTGVVDPRLLPPGLAPTGKKSKKKAKAAAAAALTKGAGGPQIVNKLGVGAKPVFRTKALAELQDVNRTEIEAMKQRHFTTQLEKLPPCIYPDVDQSHTVKPLNAKCAETLAVHPKMLNDDLPVMLKDVIHLSRERLSAAFNLKKMKYVANMLRARVDPETVLYILRMLNIWIRRTNTAIGTLKESNVIAMLFVYLQSLEGRRPNIRAAIVLFLARLIVTALTHQRLTLFEHTPQFLAALKSDLLAESTPVLWKLTAFDAVLSLHQAFQESKEYCGVWENVLHESDFWRALTISSFVNLPETKEMAELISGGHRELPDSDDILRYPNSWAHVRTYTAMFDRCFIEQQLVRLKTKAMLGPTPALQRLFRCVQNYVEQVPEVCVSAAAEGFVAFLVDLHNLGVPEAPFLGVLRGVFVSCEDAVLLAKADLVTSPKLFNLLCDKYPECKKLLVQEDEDLGRRSFHKVSVEAMMPSSDEDDYFSRRPISPTRPIHVEEDILISLSPKTVQVRPAAEELSVSQFAKDLADLKIEPKKSKNEPSDEEVEALGIHSPLLAPESASPDVCICAMPIVLNGLLTEERCKILMLRLENETDWRECTLCQTMLFESCARPGHLKLAKFLADFTADRLNQLAQHLDTQSNRLQLKSLLELLGPQQFDAFIVALAKKLSIGRLVNAMQNEAGVQKSFRGLVLSLMRTAPEETITAWLKDEKLVQLWIMNAKNGVDLAWLESTRIMLQYCILKDIASFDESRTEYFDLLNASKNTITDVSRFRVKELLKV